MGLIWGRQDPGGPHVGPVNFAIWVDVLKTRTATNSGGGSSKLMEIYVLALNR